MKTVTIENSRTLRDVTGKQHEQWHWSIRMKSYGKLCAQYYDLDKPKPPADALAFYLKQAQLSNGRILEPMCGSGRFMIPLMQAGFKIVGVDSSPEMLAAFQKKTRSMGLTAKLHLQYLHEMEVPGRFAMIMIPSGSFGLITDLPEALAGLQKLHQALQPGGRFILELDQWLEPSNDDPLTGESIISLPDGAQLKMTSTGSFAPQEKVYHGINCYELIIGGQVFEKEDEIFDLRYYQPQEISRLLAESSFKVLDLHAAYDPCIPMAKSTSFVIICTRD